MVLKRCVYCGKELEDFEDVCPRCNENQEEHTTTEDLYQEAYDEFYKDFYKKIGEDSEFIDQFDMKDTQEKRVYDQEIEQDEVLKKFIEEHNIPQEVVDEIKQKAENNQRGCGCSGIFFIFFIGFVVLIIIDILIKVIFG